MKSKILFWGIGLLALASCSSDSLMEQDEHRSALRINTNIEQTRAIVESSSFDFTADIGVNVFNTSGSIYAGTTANTEASTTGDGTWKTSTTVSLTDESAKVTAYYPYSTEYGSNDSYKTHIPISVLPDENGEQTDYLYGSSSANVDANSPTANITFKHVLTRVSLNIKRAESDKGSGVLSKVVVRAANYHGGSASAITVGGYLDTWTGKVVQTSSFGELSIPVNKTLTTTAQNVDILLFENDNVEEYVLELMIDGSPYILEFPTSTYVWKAGQRYSYPVTINRSE